jgi:hypothetical protein
VEDPSKVEEPKSAPTLTGLLASLVAGFVLFVPLWAGLNFAFGTALDGDGLGFTGRELVYIVTGLVGYAACFVGAMLVTAFLVRLGGRLFPARAG